MARLMGTAWTVLGLAVAMGTLTLATHQSEVCEGEADILFVLDASGSIGNVDYQILLDFASKVTKAFDVGQNKVQFGALVFSTYYSNEFGFGVYNNNAQVEQAILNLPYEGGLTYTGAALNSARTYSFTKANGHRLGVAKIAIVITDGRSTDSTDTATEAFLLQQSGVTVIAIGVGSNIDQTELETIASRTDLAIRVTSYGALDTIRAQVATTVCDEQTNQNTDTCFHPETSCVGKEDGNYAACNPKCAEGYYYSCSNEYRYLMPCALAYYVDDHNQRFLARMVYDPSKDACELEVDYCPRDPKDHEVIPDSGNNNGNTGNPRPCISSGDSCYGKADGNYPMCYPECKSGFYYSCSNGETYEMPCALASYVDSNNNYYTARMVYNTNTDSCELSADYCPRDPAVAAVTTGTSNSSGTWSGHVPTICHAQADILFILDSSGSIGITNFAIQSFFVADLTTYFLVGPQEVQFSAIVFSTDAYNMFGFRDFNSNYAVRQALLSTIYYGGLTNTAEALNIARLYSFSALNGARQNVGRVAIVVTDGVSTDPSATFVAADALKSSGVTVIAVGVGSYVRYSELLAIASSANHVFTVNNYNVLSVIKAELVLKTCNSGNNFGTCVKNSCIGKADGNYPACDPECKKGVYYTCQNEFAQQMPCPLATYIASDGRAFYAQMVFDPESNSCEMSVSSCPRDPENYEVIPQPLVTDPTQIYNPPCIGSYESCQGKVDGDYPMCYPDCQSGYYFSCVANEAIERPCALGWYTVNGNTVQARMIYDPSLGYCVHDAPYCPRTHIEPETTEPDTTTTPIVIPTCKSKGDVLFIVDSSGSIGDVNFGVQVTFLANLVTHLTIGPSNIQVSAITFSTDAELSFKFNRYSTGSAIWQALLGLPYMGGLTNTADALVLARNQAFSTSSGSRPGVPKVAVILTDGVSRKPSDTAVEADKLKRAGVTVIVVGIGNYVRQSELDALASSPSRIFTVNDFGVLDAIKADVVSATCQGTQSDCVTDSCAGLADNTYPICGDACKSGYYMICAAGYAYQTQCPLDIYLSKYGYHFYAPQVYDPYSNPPSCQASSGSCSREAEDYAVFSLDF